MTLDNTVFRKAYTSRDVESIRKKLIELVPTLTDKWTDFNESDPGMVIIELIASLGDLLSFYLDRQALESFLPTVSERKNAKALLKIINYRMDVIVSSLTTVKFTLSEVHAQDILIPRYTQLQTIDETLYFVTLTDVTILAGDTEIEVAAIQGERKEGSFLPSELDANHMYQFVDKDIANQSLILTYKDEEWVEVDDVISSEETDPNFDMEEDKSDNVFIRLMETWIEVTEGDEATSFYFKYVVSEGALGNIQSGQITIIVDTLKDVLDGDISDIITVSNIERATGGIAAETIDHARAHAPREVKTHWVAVTLQDYDSLVEGYPGVLKARCVDWNLDYTLVNRPYVVKVYLIPNGGGIASEELKAQVLAYLNERKVITTDITIEDPDYQTLNITANIYLNQLVDEGIIIAAVEGALETLYDPANIDFGDDIRRSNIISTIEGAHSAISYVTLATPAADVVLSGDQFILLGTINLNIYQE